jgi:TatD DNase family protein
VVRLSTKTRRLSSAPDTALPLEKLLIETDSPWLAPVPHRGKTNQPAYVKHVAAFLAELRGESLEEIAAVTTENFYRLFPSARLAA